MQTRTEEDSLGSVQVPEKAYYGAQTQRAADNFVISGLRFQTSFIQALGLIKKCAALTNYELGLLDNHRKEAILAAALEVIDGKLDDHFILDIFQTGSGTSTNMNANEVIAGRANEILTGRRGGRQPVHPNDHVNLGQSSNDVIPSAIHIAALIAVKNRLLPALERLRKSLSQKTSEFATVRKIGRTHLQDAVPMTLGQEFSGYSRQVALGIERLRAVGERLAELALGGTAVGNGLNAHPQFATKTIMHISQETGCPFRKAENHFEAQAAQDASVETSGVLKTVAVSLSKIANDIRWLASGPRCGLGEINLPVLQPGSSIMPGKVNPVIPEALIQAAAQVIGNDATITMGGLGGYFELNTMLPIIAYNLLQSIGLLASVASVFAERCVIGITANVEKCTANIERSLALSTFLAPTIGYDQAAAVSNKAYLEGKTIREVVVAMNIMSEQDFQQFLQTVPTM